MHDSGTREKFAEGAVRDAAGNKPRIDLISPFANERLGSWLQAGAEKYEPRNWEKGMPISRCIASLARHLNSYQAGDQDEDHMAAVMCNAMFIMHYEEMIERGVLPDEFDDMPVYRTIEDVQDAMTAQSGGLDMLYGEENEDPPTDGFPNAWAAPDGAYWKVVEDPGKDSGHWIIWYTAPHRDISRPAVFVSPNDRNLESERDVCQWLAGYAKEHNLMPIGLCPEADTDELVEDDLPAAWETSDGGACWRVQELDPTRFRNHWVIWYTSSNFGIERRSVMPCGEMVFGAEHQARQALADWAAKHDSLRPVVEKPEEGQCWRVDEQGSIYAVCEGRIQIKWAKSQQWVISELDSDDHKSRQEYLDETARQNNWTKVDRPS